VVTALDGDGSRQGFYLTERTPTGTASTLTSEGIFVMTRNDAMSAARSPTSCPGLKVGDLVTVTAQVMEYQSFNTMPRTVLVNSSVTIKAQRQHAADAGARREPADPELDPDRVTPDYTDSSDDAGDTFDASLYGLSFWETWKACW
jgi:predicted extracellular nuclease